ncbi:MAG TPA: iron donor protein CyaY [Bryobacteraceae bacterium]|nr:iron donor protein CyaY [Bryobacteraceae bacterium]
MDEQQFRLRADEALADAYDALVDASDEHDFETDLGDTLTVEFSDPPGKFVVSPNAPVRQIWISAHSKSFKLDWNDARQTFVLPETGQSLREILADAVSRQLGTTISL